jgi:hypothetical protein
MSEGQNEPAQVRGTPGSAATRPGGQSGSGSTHRQRQSSRSMSSQKMEFASVDEGVTLSPVDRQEAVRLLRDLHTFCLEAARLLQLLGIEEWEIRKNRE